MSKLLFVFESDMPTVSILKDVWTHISDERITSDFLYLSDISEKDIDSHDVIILVRPANIYSWVIAKKGREAGHMIVTFCDDDLLNLPKGEPMMAWRRRGLKKALRYSDAIMSSSKYILNKYVSMTAGGRVAAIDTILQKEELEGIKEKRYNKKVKIVYAAGSSHAWLFEKIVKPIVPDLVRELGDVFSFTFVGVHPKMDDINCDNEFVSGMTLHEYRKYMKKANFDIGVAPLIEDEFSKCKYYNKYIEYSTQGICGIYSNTEPYTYVVKDEVNGFLADNNPESWLLVLKKVIIDRAGREKCVRNAIEDLKSSHSEGSIMSKIKKDIPEMFEAPLEYKECRGIRSQKLLYVLSRPLDWLYLTFFYLRKNGFKDVVDRACRRLLNKNTYDRKE